MRRDVGFYIEANIQQVYQAYLTAASNKPFERDCKQEPFHTISFGVNFSMKYNMNGGACILHFMPYGTGTAVNIRFSIAQAAGARYGKYAEDLNRAAQPYLPVPICPASYNMDDFLRPENQVTPVSLQQQAAPQAFVPQQPPASPQAPAAPAGYCAHCGNPIAQGSRFCAHCGTQVAPPAPKACPNCSTPVGDADAFCAHCGTRL